MKQSPGQTMDKKKKLKQAGFGINSRTWIGNMKFVHISFRFEFTEHIEAILDRHGISDYVRYPMIEGKGQDGKHFGTQVFPGNYSVVQAKVDDERLKGLFEELDSFRRQKKAHEHLRALAISVSDSLGF